MATNLTASQQLADLVRVRHAAHPDETHTASWKAVESDPRNAKLFADYKREVYPGLPSKDVAVPRAGTTLNEDAPVDVRFAEAVNATMARCGLVGTAGREAATSLVIRTEPELAAEYTRHLRVRL